MRKTMVFLAAMLPLLALSTSEAQCNRGSRGRGGTATGRFASPITSRGLTSPLAALNPIISSPSAAFLATQYRSQLAQQQYLLAQQQRYLQALSQRQRDLPSQLSSTPATEKDSATDDRRKKLRRENAEKAFQQAERAETNGRLSVAQRSYRKVVRILGDGDALSRRAANALQLLAQRKRNPPNRDTLLTSHSN